jgi:hypothetical protein
VWYVTVREATTIRCSTVLQRPRGNLLNKRENATCIWTCGQVSVLGRKQNVTRTTCSADKLTMAALISAVGTNDFILSIFPLEKVCVEISGEQITGSSKNVITDLWGEQVAQVLYDRRGMVQKCDFPFVYWEGMEQVMKSFPEMFRLRVWVTKHVSHFQGTNCQLSRISRPGRF